MSLKSGEGKSLKGLKSTAGGAGDIDMRTLLAALSTAGLVLSNVTLQNIMAWSGMMDDVAIGSMLPNTGAFTKVTVGIDQEGTGGHFIIYGDKATKFHYDDQGNVVSSTPGDQVSWNPATGLFQVLGTLSVRDAVQFGNIVMRGNKIMAIAPTDGNVEIYPESSNGYITIGGNIAQNLPGVVQFNKATEYSIDSIFGRATVNSKGDNLLSTEKGDISLITDSKSYVQIASIVHRIVTTATIVFVSDITGIVTETDVIQTITGIDLLQQTETTKANGVTIRIKVVEKKRTVLNGQPAIRTTVTITSITPATLLQPEKRITTTTTETVPITTENENDFQPLQDDTVTSVQRMAIVTTVGRHGLSQGEAIRIFNTNSLPSYDGQWTVDSADDDNQFVLAATGYFAASNQGYFTTMSRNGSIHISAAKQVRFEIGVPLVFGPDDLSYRPTLEATSQDDLVITAHYIQMYDPIPTLRSPSNGFSDAGMTFDYLIDGVVQHGFFGFVQSTENFTWIPKATITRASDGSKAVSGAKGVMELSGMQVTNIVGGPDLVISAPQGTVTFDSALPINFPSIGIANAGILKPVDGDGNSLSIASSSGNVAISAPNGSIDLQSKVTIGSTVLSAAVDGLKISSSDKLTFAVNDSVVVPEDVFLQIGDIGPRATGFVGHQGTLSAYSVSDMSLFSGGNVALTSQGNLSLTAGGGVTNLNSSHVYLPALAELEFGQTNTYISTMPSGTLTVHAQGQPVVVSSTDNVTLSSPQVNLFANASVNVPDDVPLAFGTDGGHVRNNTQDGLLYISNPDGVVIDKDLVVSGSLTVYGPTTEISSTSLVLKDPIITLGSSGTAEYVKDRGVQFYYGDGKLGFMGFGQEYNRFYLLQDGTNHDEVFDKSTLGDLQLNKLYANMIVSSENGFMSTFLSGYPYLDISATYIRLLARDYVYVPDNVPLQFGTAANSIYGTGDALNLDAAEVNIVQGHLNVGTAAIGATLNVGDDVSFAVQGKTASITGTDAINLDGILSVPESVFIGAASISADDVGNLVISTNNEATDVLFQSKVRFADSGATMGNSSLYWDESTSRLVLSSADLSLQTNVHDARWMGQVIETQYGGTGRQNDWLEKCVVFVGAGGTALDQDAGNFVYDTDSASLALRTDSFEDALTIGRGNIDLLDDSAAIIFRTGNVRSWKTGKHAQNHYATSSIHLDGTETHVLLMNSFGQMAFGGDASLETRFLALTGTETDSRFLFGTGDIAFVQPSSSCVRWFPTTYITSNVAEELVLTGLGNAVVLGKNGIVSTSAGTIQLVAATDVVVTAGADLNVSAGDNANVSIGGTLHLSGGQELSLYCVNGNVSLHGNNVSVQTPGAFTLDSDVQSFTASTSISMEAPTISFLVSDALNFTVDGNQTITATGDVTISSTGGKVSLETTEEDIILSSGRDLIFSAVRDWTCEVGGQCSFGVTAALAISAASLSAVLTHDMNITSENFNITTGNALISVADNFKTQAKDVAFDTSNVFAVDARLINLTAVNGISVTNGGDLSVNVSGATTMESVGPYSMHSDDKLSISAMDSCILQTGAGLSLQGTTGISIDSPSMITVTSGAAGTTLQSDGIIEATARGKVTVTSQEGNVVIGSNSADVSLNAAGALNFTSGGAMNAHASNDWTVNVGGSTSLISGSTVSVSSTSSTVDLSSPSRIRLLAPEVFTYSTLIMAEETTTISATSGGILKLSSAAKMEISSPHVILSQGRLCIHHDASDVCTTFATFSADTQNLDIVNSIGNINLSPLSQIFVPDNIKIQLGNSGFVRGDAGQMVISSVADITLQPASRMVNLPANAVVNFGNRTNLIQTLNRFVVSGPDPVFFQVPSVHLPDRVPLIFGDETRQIVSDGDTLFIKSKDLLSLESATVRIMGNLVVSKTSTFIIETETNFDSGIITLGGGETRTIMDLQQEDETNTKTRVTVAQEHHLRPGDVVTLVDTNPNIDGRYVVDSVPSATQFTVDVPFPGLPSGESITGTVRSRLTENPGTDAGIQFNWHTGSASDTSGARAGFFGFDRSTQRLIYIPDSTRVNDVFQGSAGDMEIRTLYAENISATNIISPIDTGGNAVTGSNFVISGGTLNNVPIGNTVPSVGTFTHLTVTDGLVIGEGDIVANLNADLLDNHHASDFVLRDGSSTLTSDWNGGSFRITAAGFSDVTLTPGGIVSAGEGGKLETWPDITYSDGVLTVSKLAGFQLVGDVDLNEHVLGNGTLSQVTIDSGHFSGGTIDAADISNVNMTGATITDSNLNASAFAQGTITASTMDASSVTNAALSVGTMDGYVITDTRFSQGTVDETAITGGTMTGTSVLDAAISSSTFSNGNISDSNATNVELMASVFSSGTVDSTAFIGGSIANSSVTGVTVSASTLNSVSLSNSAFASGTIDSTSFTSGNITATVLSAVDIGANSTITDSTLVDVGGSNVSLSGSSFSGGTIDSTSFSNGSISMTTATQMDIVTSTIASSSLTDVVLSASTLSDIDVSNGRLISSSFDNGTLDNDVITNSTFNRGDITNSYLADATIVNSTFTNGNVAESNVTLESENTLDVSRGTVVFANGQIKGEWITGGIPGGNADTVTDGLYRRDFAQDNSMLKADVAGQPSSFPVPEETLVGRRTGGTVQPLNVETVQDMLDIVEKQSFTDNSILKADVTGHPMPLTVPENTIVGRLVNDVITSLSPEQVIEMIMTTEALHRYGAVLRDGHRTFEDGGAMTGLLYYSTERFAISTGQTSALDLNVETSYVSVNYSRAGGRLAKLTLGRGFADGHRKVIILSRIGEPAILQVFTDFLAPETIDPYVFVFRHAGQSAVLQWDTVLSRWLIVGSGCEVLTRDELRDPNWMD